jgi:type IV secretion system protein TrbE
LLQALATGWLRYPRSRVVLFDRDRSSLLLARASEAAYYDLGGPGVALQPLRHLDSESDLATTLSWLESLFAVQLPSFSAQNRNVVAAALTRLAHLDPSHRTLSMLKLQLQDPDLAAALEPFTETGPYGSYLGASHETLDVDRFQIFEMAALFGLESKIQLPILWYLLTRLELQLDGSPTLILLDEAGLALLHTYFSEVIKEWALRLRKKNCVLVLAVQTLAQLTQNDSFNTLLESCPTRIFLPNPAASSHAVAGFYRACNLNDKQIQRIAESCSKRDYYFVNPDGSRLMELALTPADLAFYSTVPGLSLQATHTRMHDAIAQHGPTWPVDWLHHLGLNEAAARLARLYEETHS